MNQIRLYKDGDTYFAIYGDDPQVEVTGSGKTLGEALAALHLRLSSDDQS